jgi:hypothetical protein
MFTDPTLMVRIVDELRVKLAAAKTTIAELRGSLHRNLAAPSAPSAPAAVIPAAGSTQPGGWVR